MNIVVSDFIEKINAKDYQSQSIAYAPQNNIDPKELALTLWTELQKLLVQEQLATVELKFELGSETVCFSLETSIINLPWENINRVDNFFDDATQSVPVEVYLIVRAESLNQSGLRIDQIASVTEVKEQSVKPDFVIKVAEFIAIIQKNQVKDA